MGDAGLAAIFPAAAALATVLGELPPAREVSVEAVLQAYGLGTTREFSEVLELDEAAAVATLRQAGVRSRSLAGSQLWSVE